MSEITRIQDALRPHLSWHGARLGFLALVLVALFRVETVNLDKLASVFSNHAKSASNHKRLTRFFRQFPMDFDELAVAIVKWSQLPQPWTLSLDRTTWSFGRVNFNILMLGIVHEGVAFPLMWTLLDKRGNSNSDERMNLLERFERVFPQAKIRCLTADREFVGSEWFSFLLLPRTIPFRIRLRHSDRISSRSGKTCQRGERLFASLREGEQRVMSGKRWVWGCRIYLAATRLKDGELVVIATNRHPETALGDYRQRWGIETLFGALKTRGFNLESTHFQHPERLSKLLGVLSLGFCWAMLTGLWQHQQSPIPLKAHGRRAKSLFRSGCDFLRRTFCDLSLRQREFEQALKLLSLY